LPRVTLCDMSDVTRILQSIEDGDPKAAEELLPLVYDELRKLAAAKMAQEKPGQTLQATALVHDAYLRLVDTERAGKWDSRGHFFAAAAEAMRRILVDSARRKQRIKHGGDRDRVDLDDVAIVGGAAPDELLSIHETIDRLAVNDIMSATVAKLCYFSGLDIEQAAEILDVSRATAYRHWAYAKAWLHREIKRQR
jgi:RNA polymerase sigma factor (TIGR02999 family)